MEKSIKNANEVIYKLGLASTKVTNNRLEIARKERQKREKMIKRRKTEAMVVKRDKARGGISLFNKNEDESDIVDNIDLD